MKWDAKNARWRRLYKGQTLIISAKKLGITPPTMEASRSAAYAWARSQMRLIDAGPTDRRKAEVDGFLSRFRSLDPDARRAILDELVGPGTYDRLDVESDAVLDRLVPIRPERSVEYQFGEWSRTLGARVGKNLSADRHAAYVKKGRIFVDFLGRESAVDAIDGDCLERYFIFLSEQITSERFTATTAKDCMYACRRFVRFLAGKGTIPEPNNIGSRDHKFGQSVARTVEIFGVDEVHRIIAASSPRTRLFVLLALNIGATQSDIDRLRPDEVDWVAGTITRRRSKMSTRGGAIVRYKLWPATLALLKRFGVREGERVLLDPMSKPLIERKMKDGHLVVLDRINSGWLSIRVGGRKPRLPMKHLRKTCASLLDQHPEFHRFAERFLAHAPKSVAGRHYLAQADEPFFAALDWLGNMILQPKDGEPSVDLLADQ